LLVALISILVYVGFRFEWRLAAGVVIALAHDVIITLGILSLFLVDPHKMRYVAFEGGGEPVTALMGNHVQVVSGDLSEMVPYLGG
ncbi:hypothetical protein MJI69_27830, partial [Salmonella enterica subsp. enterica serovar Anatum]|nr:hypothetical protein [Salmonella enterica subsp. enterica serovar Anatum]